MSTDSLDTNLLVHFILGDVPAQRTMVLRLLRTPRTLHRVEDLAIAETVYVLEKVYAQERTEVVAELKMFLAHYDDQLSYNEKLFNRVWPIYLEHPKLSFVDCCLATYAELNGAEPLMTFDRKMANQLTGVKRLD